MTPSITTLACHSMVTNLTIDVMHTHRKNLPVQSVATTFVSEDQNTDKHYWHTVLDSLATFEGLVVSCTSDRACAPYDVSDY